MSLTGAQFDAIMREYEHTRNLHADEREKRLAEVSARIPEYHTLDRSVPDIGLAAAKMIANGTAPDFTSLRDGIGDIARKKEQLLRDAGFPADYTDLRYTCPDCLDTGFSGEKRCHCLEDKIRHILYRQSNLSALITENNFDMMSEAYHTGDDLRRFKSAVASCKRMIAQVGSGKGYDNLLFFGPVGSGKTFLSIATAKELLDLGCSVLYFSAVGLFEYLSDAVFSQEGPAEREKVHQDLTTCDVLLIDDLGTELTNAFVSSRLFHLINERHLKQRATIISTNLDFAELRNRYSDRVFSRLASNYTVCELTGTDVRLARKALRHRA